MDKLKTVLEYWFGDLGRGNSVPAQSEMWFKQSNEVDDYIRQEFEPTVVAAVEGRLESWETMPRGRLALIILLDQFSRHIYRGTPRAFVSDAQSLQLAMGGVALGEDRILFPLERSFLYMPLEHSEELHVQERSVELYTKLVEESPTLLREYLADNLRYAVRHHEIIRRFGRFPHRNAILGRESTAEEIEFLKEPLSSF